MKSECMKHNIESIERRVKAVIPPISAQIDIFAQIEDHWCLGPCKSGIYYSPLAESKFYM